MIHEYVQNKRMHALPTVACVTMRSCNVADVGHAVASELVVDSDVSDEAAVVSEVKIFDHHVIAAPARR